MAAKIVSIPKGAEPRPLPSSDELKAATRLFPLKLDMTSLYLSMGADKTRLLNDRELEFAKQEKDRGDNDLSDMSLRFVANSLCARCADMDSGDINDASGALLLLGQLIYETHDRQCSAFGVLEMHYRRLAGVAEDEK